MFGSALFNPLFDHGSPPAPVVRTDNFGKPIPWRHALILIVRLRSQRLRDSSSVVTGLVCACTHYLVFKEPTNWKRPGRLFAIFPKTSFAPTVFCRRCRLGQPRFGELTDFTIAEPPCQLLSASFF